MDLDVLLPFSILGTLKLPSGRNPRQSPVACFQFLRGLCIQRAREAGYDNNLAQLVIA
jgi:hypothetical protein